MKSLPVSSSRIAGLTAALLSMVGACANAGVTSVTSSAYLSPDEEVNFFGADYSGALTTIDVDARFSSTVTYDSNFDFGNGVRLVVTLTNTGTTAWTGFNVSLTADQYPLGGWEEEAATDSPAAVRLVLPIDDAMETSGSGASTVDFATFDAAVAPGQSFSFYIAPQDLNPNGGSFVLSGTALTAGAPEPATWATLLIGLAGLGATMRSARRKQARAAA